MYIQKNQNQLNKIPALYQIWSINFFLGSTNYNRSRFTLKLCRKSTRIQSFSLMVLQRTTSIKVLSEIVGLLRPQHALQRNPNSLKR